jgi:hypothetical protein
MLRKFATRQLIGALAECEQRIHTEPDFKRRAMLLDISRRLESLVKKIIVERPEK